MLPTFNQKLSSLPFVVFCVAMLAWTLLRVFLWTQIPQQDVTPFDTLKIFACDLHF